MSEDLVSDGIEPFDVRKPMTGDYPTPQVIIRQLQADVEDLKARLVAVEKDLADRANARGLRG